MARVVKYNYGYKYGFINTNGEVIAKCKFDYADDFSKGIAIVKKDGKSFKINTKGNFIVLDDNKNEVEISKEFDEFYEFKESFARVKKYGKYGFINSKGEFIVECKFYYADNFSEGFARVRKDNKYGFINTKGEVVIECKFDEADDFKEGIAIAGLKKYNKYNFKEGFTRARKDGKWYQINRLGWFIDIVEVGSIKEKVLKQICRLIRFLFIEIKLQI